MYFCKAPRIYVLTRKEKETGVYVCPFCGKVLKKGSLSKSEKLFQCRTCGFKITGRDILSEYPNQKVSIDIGIEIQKVAKVIVSETKEEKDPFGFAKSKAHQIFEKAKKADNNVSQWEITTEKQSPELYKFNAFPRKSGNDAVIAIEVTKRNQNLLGKEIESVTFSILVKGGKEVFSIQTSNIYAVKSLFDKILRKDFTEFFSTKTDNKMTEVKNFIKSKFHLTPDEEDSDSLHYATRDHGDVEEETPGKEDIQLIKQVISGVKAKFKNLVLRPEIVDEWVQLEIKLEG